MRKLLLLASFFFVLPLFGYTVTPASGPAAGGTEVTIDGVGGFWEYDFVYFGVVPAASTRRVDADTIIAVTPPHVPATVPVLLWEYDIFVNTAQTFTFTGEVPPAAFERLLLPIFMPPVPGAFGSEFRTELSGLNHGRDWMPIHGLKQECQCVPMYGQETLRLFPHKTLDEIGVAYEGKPGRFLYIAPDQAKDFSANLRVYDTSRAAENFGTEIPIVRASAFRTTPFALLGMPGDPRFRGTLRLYADRPTTVTVRFGNTASVVTLHGGATVLDPAYAQIGNVPGGRVIVEPDPNGAPVWGFISVTNNETQHITTITPRP